MSRTTRAVFSCLALVCAAAVPAAGQATPQAPAPAAAASHKHYEADPRADQAGPQGQLAPRLQNLGTHVFPVTTSSARAQLYINQGVRLAWAFNHAEAGRAFREAARLDPKCAMAYWGQALVLGPNINAVMDPKDEPQAYELAQKALSLKSRVPPREQAYIAALAERYSGRAEDRRARDEAYAAAMKRMVAKFPRDLDATALYIESMMNLRPWDYWRRDGQPQPGYAEVIALTEQVLAKAPNHPGALHLYIHLMESTRPDKAVVAADRLLPLMPAAGHMVHMPSHIYHRVGMYERSIHSNELAIAADEDYITQCRAQGMYPMAYYPHNVHFLWWSTSFDGQSARAIAAAKKVAGGITDAMLAETPLLAGFRVIPYYALARFGHWDEVLALPAPPPSSPFLVGAWHYVRGLALVANGKLDEADKELEGTRSVLADKALDAPLFSPNTSRAVLSIAPEVLAGEIAAARRDYDAAVLHLERAVRLEDGLVYTEPSEWHYPPRQALGAVLLAAGRPSEAETVYWDDLKRNPGNGWSLFGLRQALEAQGKSQQAAEIAARFKEAWSRADVTLQSSRFSAPAATTTAAAP